MEEWYECVLADFDGPVRSCEELPCLRELLCCVFLMLKLSSGMGEKSTRFYSCTFLSLKLF